MNDQLAEVEEASPGPGPSSEQAPSSWLQRTRKRVQSSPNLRLVIEERQPVCVLAVQRYLGENGRCRYNYDITLYDGVLQDTWLLSPELSHLIHTKRLCCGSRVTITLCSYRYVEKKLRGGLLCIDDLESGGHVTPEDSCVPVPGGKPLSDTKLHYIPLWNNEDPYGELWERSQQASPARVDGQKSGRKFVNELLH